MGIATRKTATEDTILSTIWSTIPKTDRSSTGKKHPAANALDSSWEVGKTGVCSVIWNNKHRNPSRNAWTLEYVRSFGNIFGVFQLSVDSWPEIPEQGVAQGDCIRCFHWYLNKSSNIQPLWTWFFNIHIAIYVQYIYIIYCIIYI